MDAVFWSRIKKLVRIVIPGWRSKEVLDLVLLTVFLVMRTFLSIYLASVNGRIVKAIIERNLTLFVQRVLLPPRRSSGWDWSRCPPPSSTPSSTSSTADWRCASSGGSPSTSTRPTCRT